MESIKNRIKNAIEFLKEKKSFLVGDLRLGVNERGDIEVTGWSQYTNLKNLTKEKSIEELKEIKNLFIEMVHASPELEEFVKRKDIEYSLFFDDYGKASIAICSEKGNVIKWHMAFNKL